MKRHAARFARWTVRILVGFGLLLVVAALLLWWWAGQEGSLQWVLRHVGGNVPLRSEGVEGSVRGVWHIAHIAWEKDGLRLEADDIRLRWEPLALLDRTLQLQELQVARARVIDTRPRNDEPLAEPAQLRLPWRVDVQSLKVDALAYQGRVQVEGGKLSGRYAFDGLHHRVGLDGVQLAGGEYRGEATLLAVAPLTLDAKVAGRVLAPVPKSSERVPLELSAQARGPLRTLDAQAQLHVAEGGAPAGTSPSATATARITPFEAMPLPRALADVQQVDLALFWPQAPRTLLSGHVEVEPVQKNAYRLQVDLRNGDAGPWDAHRVPVESLRASGQWRDGTALVESLLARAGGGRVEGAGRWQGAGWTFDGEVHDVDPAQLHTAVAALPLTGPVKFGGEGQSVAFDVALQAGAPRASAKGLAGAAGALDLRDLLAKGRFGNDVVSFAQLRLRTGDALLEGEGEWQLVAHAGKGRLQLRAPGLQARGEGNVSETHGQGTAEITASDLAQAQRWLARWPGVGPALKDIGLRGQAQAQLAWQGGWKDPTVQGHVNARTLAWQADAANTPAWVLREADVQVRGRLRDAALQLRAQAEQGQRKLDLAAAGRLGAALGTPVRWHGQVATLTAQWLDPALTPGPWRVVLQRPFDWQAAGGDFDVAGGEAVLRAPAMPSGAAASDAQLTWGPLRRHAGQLTTSGRVAGLPLAWIELVGGTQAAGAALSGDLVFDAQWNAQLGPTVRIEGSLARVRGDVMVQAETADGGTARVNAGVREARLDVRAQGEQLDLRMLWDSERAGHVEGNVRSRIVRHADGSWSWPQEAPLSGRVQASLPRIGVWSLLAPPGWRLRGSLSADIRVAGTRAEPLLSGPVNADDLALRSVVDGIELRNGRMRAQLAGQRLVVNEFVLHGAGENGSDGGTLLAQGEARWTPQGPVVQAEVQLSLLRASIRSDRQLTVSGVAAAHMDRQGTEVTGKLVVDRARIQIPDQAEPRLADDVVVHNAPGLAATDAERRQRPPPGPGAQKLKLSVFFDLGKDFRISGRGVDTRLSGTVEVRNGPQGAPELVGIIQANGGTYQAYGEKLNIERGEVRFTGAPDNPALDILAVRPNMVQKVGVQVTGRAQSPHVELYNDAGLSDAETLSYVVLGRSSTGGGQEAALLQRAATALLAGRGGTGKGLAGTVGLDDLSVAPDSAQGAIVRVGKRFANNIYASYERSLSGAMGTLFLFYDVSQRFTVRAEAGERTGVDVIFTFKFDRVGGAR